MLQKCNSHGLANQAQAGASYVQVQRVALIPNLELRPIAGV